MTVFCRHLRSLGLVEGEPIRLTQRNETTSSLLSEIAGWRSTNLGSQSTRHRRRAGLWSDVLRGCPARRVDSTESEGETEEVLTLNDLKVGETAVVVKLHGQGAVRRRIMDMGITKGVPVRVQKVCPLGDPVEITVLDYELTLRKNDCALVKLKSGHLTANKVHCKAVITHR